MAKDQISHDHGTCPSNHQFIFIFNLTLSLTKQMTAPEKSYNFVVCRIPVLSILITVLNSQTRSTNLGRAVEHNRQSRFDLCYCQFYGLKVHSSDTDRFSSWGTLAKSINVWRLDFQSMKLTVTQLRSLNSAINILTPSLHPHTQIAVVSRLLLTLAHPFKKGGQSL